MSYSPYGRGRGPRRRGDGGWRQNMNATDSKRGAQSLNDLSEPVDMYLTRCQLEHSGIYPGRRNLMQDESQRRDFGRGRGRSRGNEQWRGHRGRGGHRYNETPGNFDTGEARYQKRKRQYPIGRTQIQQLLEMQADVIVLELLREQSGYQIFVREDSVHSENLLLMMSVLSRACSTKSNKENLHELFNITCEQKFMDKLCAFTMAVKRQYPDKASMFFIDLHTFLDAYANAMTTNAIDRIPNLVDACLSVLTVLEMQGVVSRGLILKYEELQKMLTEAQEKWNQRKNQDTKNQKGYVMDSMEPPDNFQDLPVVPVAYDLSTKERPFLRRNIVQGRYQDDDHYLDIQFRLLREDFVRPLRNGINDFRDGIRKVRDIRIYNNVFIKESIIKNKKIIHLVQLNLPPKFNVEHSKRLLYGNLLCFTNDNFKSMFLASVAERNPENAEKGMIGVAFESDISGFDLSQRFLMVESRAYFMAYKHVLQALKDMGGNGVPMAPYIIHVNCKVQPPSYLEINTHYDLRVVKEIKMMKMSEARNKLFQKVIRDDPSDAEDRWLQLSRIPMRRGLESWPTQLELSLDKSQHKALHGALTNELAIIQGPPGTGKTFIGLKITQILLHNSQIWKKEDNPTPILVVCFTNHALDQFLEGMTSYTESIVRVGSRSKNEAIGRFQADNLVRSLCGSRMIPGNIYDRSKILFDEVVTLEREMKHLYAVANGCKNPEGVLSLGSFLQELIIPKHIERQLTQRRREMIGWLLHDIDSVDLENSSKKQMTPKEFNDYHAMCAKHDVNEENVMDNENVNGKQGDQENNDENLIDDAEELLQLEEENRRLDEEYEDDIGNERIRILYEKTFAMFDEELMELSNSENPADYFLYTILADQKKAFYIGLNLPEKPREMAELEKADINIWNLDFPTRWTLYKHWLSKLFHKVMKNITTLEREYQKKAAALQEIKHQKYLYIMRNASIVGMTTTGAAQYSALMQDLAPAIVIIEEAAEILESHVITSLTRNCQHLILIGDHQQLRPSATVFELATKFGLETSLFERMIKNGLTYECLEYQHRMRPSISKLLVPSIYPNLKDDISVTKYPHVKGVAKDLFFISHQIHEKEESDDNNSHENRHEADILIALCRHLMLQGYDADEVTILTPYSGQFFLLKKLQREHPACNGVRICVVDNFQGEENKIILLSLVRSNVEGKVGFLRTDNRVCVALSRAKQGLYITGNMDLLCSSSKLWQDIRKDLEAEGNFDSALPLKCENHPDEIQRVSTGEEFFKKSPEGGCLRVCNKTLPRCDHLCPKVCHMDDPNHDFYKCRIPCPKTLCNLDHPCPKQCWETCGRCQVKVRKTLPCSHTHSIPCHVDPEKHKCPTKVKKTLPDCHHEDSMPCHEKPESWKCPVDCDTRLDCGHMCRQKCHVKVDPDHKKYDCQQNCTRLNAGCTQNHLCQKKCYEECGSCVKEITKVLPCGHTANNIKCHVPPEKVQCQEKCKRTLSCGHACKNMCYKPCGNCPVKVKKVVPRCNHTVLIACGEEATTDKCDGACPKILQCGHPCLARCNEPCTNKCPVKIPSTAKCPKNHSIMVPCHQNNTTMEEDLWLFCDKPCGQMLGCDHPCGGKCGQCFQGRVHELCMKPCNKSLVCGHICKHPCSANCPPCQEKCEWQCSHSKCKKNCGIPCIPCKEPCQRQCKHVKCDEFCGSRCSRKPCDKPCEKKLKCKHDCIGFCGDPCPPLCRICNADMLTDFILLGFEEDNDARFVLLEDCGHCIEVTGLEGWLNQADAEIGMKTCPRCRKPIYNSRRYKNIVLETYKLVKAVKKKYYTQQTHTKRKEIEAVLSEDYLKASNAYYLQKIQQLQKNVGLGSSKTQKQKFLNESELQLYHFQAVVLKKVNEILLSCKTSYYPSLLYTHAGKQESNNEMKLKAMLDLLVDRVMQRKQIIPSQMVEEVGCELQRMMILPAYWNMMEKSRSMNNTSLTEIVVKLAKIMDPTIKFDPVTEKRVKELLKESEKFVGGLGISQSERLMIVQAMGLKQGHWYKCPNGHVYCITECGGAQQKSRCPDCGSDIGGVNYRLSAGNAVAGEMDGARAAAWS